MNKAQKAAQILIDHQAWRLGGDGEPTNPQVLTSAINHAIEALQSMQWQPIETAPSDGTEIIITNGFEVYTGKYKKSHITNYQPYFCKSCDGYELNDGHDYQHIPIYMYNPTHFMPLPTPPEGAE